MAATMGRGLLSPMVLLIFCSTLIELALAGWALNRYIDNNSINGNSATFPFLIFALISGMVGAGSLFATLNHLRLWRSDTLQIAAATTQIDLMLSLLALGLACKEINVGGYRDGRLKTLEAFVIILAGLKIFKLVTLHGAMYSEKLGPEENRKPGIGVPAASAV